MWFSWLDIYGDTHERFIDDYEERLKFIYWLETSAEVVSWW